MAAALHRRDITTANAALAVGPAEERAWIPVLADLSRVTVHSRERLGLYRDRHAVLQVADLDGDGSDEIATNGFGQGRDSSIVLRAEPGLSEWGRVRWPGPVEAVLPLPHALTGAPTLLSTHPAGPEYRLQLSRVVDGAPVVDATWGPGESRWFGGATADLDGDGALELYLGSGPYARRLSRFDHGPGGWTRRVANHATDAARSDMLPIAVGDLDGDGRPELVVAPGPWTAYDLRVLRARADARPGVDDSLELVARRTFGTLKNLTLARTRVGRRIVVVKTDDYPNAGRHPPGRPTGEPAGLYVAELRGDELAVVEHLPTPPSWRTPQPFDDVLAGDLDGDGEDELVAALAHQAGMILLRWHEDRLLPPLVLTGLTPLLVHDLDHDGRDEIVASDATDPDRVLVFGAGDELLAAAPPATDAVRPVPPGISDPAVADAWRRAEELAAIGAPRRAADELVTLARISGHVPEDMLLRAAELYEDIGADALAAGHYVAAAAAPALADRARAGAIRCRRRLGEFAAAAELAAARLPALAPTDRAVAAAELAALRRAAAPRPEQRFDFAAALDPMWRISDPLAIRRDPGRGALAVWPTRTPVAADFPLEWDGGPLTFVVDLELDRLEWSQELNLGIADADEPGAPWISIRVTADGSTAAPQPTVLFVIRGHDVTLLGTFAAGTRLRAGITVVPELGVAVLTSEVAGRRTQQVRELDLHAPPAGPLRLFVGGAERLAIEYVGRVWLHGVEVTGAVPGARLDVGEPAARMLAELDLAGAAAAVRDAASGPALLWRAEALAGLGRLDEAAAAIAAVPEDSPEHAALIHRLRRERDALTLAARAGLGSRWIDVVAREGDAQRPIDDLAALTDWPTLRGPPPADASPQARARHLWALLLRGRAQITLGHLDEAGDDLAVAAAALAHADDDLPGRGPLRDAVAEAQVRLAATRGDIAGLRGALDHSLASSPISDIKFEMVMNDPQIRAVLGADDLVALRRRHRAR